MTILRMTLCVAAATAILGASGAAQMNPLDKQSTSKDAVCPLSDSQAQKSIDAFAKIVPTLTQEPRCLNCHGGVDPFPTRPRAIPPIPVPRAPRTAREKWRLASARTATANASQARRHFLDLGHGNPRALFSGQGRQGAVQTDAGCIQAGANFIGHLTDDNGNSNFTGTAFLGNRGLNDQGQSHVTNYKPEPPRRMTQGGLISLGNDWIAATGGEFKGDVDCGCSPCITPSGSLPRPTSTSES